MPMKWPTLPRRCSAKVTFWPGMVVTRYDSVRLAPRAPTCAFTDTGGSACAAPAEVTGTDPGSVAIRHVPPDGLATAMYVVPVAASTATIEVSVRAPPVPGGVTTRLPCGPLSVTRGGPPAPTTLNAATGRRAGRSTLVTEPLLCAPRGRAGVHGPRSQAPPNHS